MNWKSKSEPQVGAEREKIKFAWLPTLVKSTWIWFEKYISVQKYGTYSYMVYDSDYGDYQATTLYNRWYEVGRVRK